MVAASDPALLPPDQRPLRGRAEIVAAHNLLSSALDSILAKPEKSPMDFYAIQSLRQQLRPLCWVLRDDNQELLQGILDALATARQSSQEAPK